MTDLLNLLAINRKANLFDYTSVLDGGLGGCDAGDRHAIR